MSLKELPIPSPYRGVYLSPCYLIAECVFFLFFFGNAAKGSMSIGTGFVHVCPVLLSDHIMSVVLRRGLVQLSLMTLYPS